MIIKRQIRQAQGRRLSTLCTVASVIMGITLRGGGGGGEFGGVTHNHGQKC